MCEIGCGSQVVWRNPYLHTVACIGPVLHLLAHWVYVNGHLFTLSKAACECYLLFGCNVFNDWVVWSRGGSALGVSPILPWMQKKKHKNIYSFYIYMYSFGKSLANNLWVTVEIRFKRLTSTEFSDTIWCPVRNPKADGGCRRVCVAVLLAGAKRPLTPSVRYSQTSAKAKRQLPPDRRMLHWQAEIATGGNNTVCFYHHCCSPRQSFGHISALPLMNLNTKITITQLYCMHICPLNPWTCLIYVMYVSWNMLHAWVHRSIAWQMCLHTIH